MQIDVLFDFTSDTPGYWDGFWETREGLGLGSADPDSRSPTQRIYHKLLWSRELPNGQFMRLDEDYGRYLSWNGMRFGADSITTSFRFVRCGELIGHVMDSMEDYRGFMESFLHKAYTIGGAIIFPRHTRSINQVRGSSAKICDRWDLTLECIRRHYAGEWSPMESCLAGDKAFFDLFIDFRGYVDFFLLQDCVDNDYNVKIWMDTDLWQTNPFPKDVDEYLDWIQTQLDFVDRRNKRIGELARGMGL